LIYLLVRKPVKSGSSTACCLSFSGGAKKLHTDVGQAGAGRRSLPCGCGLFIKIPNAKRRVYLFTRFLYPANAVHVHVFITPVIFGIPYLQCFMKKISQKTTPSRWHGFVTTKS